MCYWLGQLACRAEVKSALLSAIFVGRVEVHQIVCVSSVSADSLQCHVGKEGSWTFGFDEALPGVFVSLPSPFDA
jgi:hypothetical protein